MTYDLNDDYFSCKLLLKQGLKGRYRYLYKGEYYDLSDSEAVCKVQNLLIEGKDYRRAKDFNEYLMLVTRINQFPQWLHYPVNIQVEHTNRCNARCVMCGHFNAEKSFCSDLESDTVQWLSAFLPFVRYVGLHGYGEPFLTKNLISYLEIYKKFGIRLYVNSNLNYLPDQLIPYIRDCFDEINVSCDGVTAKVYEEIRMGLSFQKLTDNLKRINESCPNLRLRLFVVIMRQNLLQLPLFIDFARKYSFSEIVFSEMIPLAENHNQADSVKNYPVLYREMLSKALEKAREYNIPVRCSEDASVSAVSTERGEELKKLQRTELIRRDEILRDSREHKKESNLLFFRKRLNTEDLKISNFNCRGICDNFFNQLYVTLDGRIAVCCVDGLHYVAEISEVKDMPDYWNLASVKGIRDTFSSGRLPFFCENCNFLLLDGLRYLKLTDSAAYSRNVGGKEVGWV